MKPFPVNYTNKPVSLLYLLIVVIVLSSCRSCKETDSILNFSVKIFPECGGPVNFSLSGASSHFSAQNLGGRLLVLAEQDAANGKGIGFFLPWEPSSGTYDIGSVVNGEYIDLYYDPGISIGDIDQYGGYYPPGEPPGTVIINRASLNDSRSNVTLIEITVSNARVRNSAGEILCINGTLNYYSD